MGPTSSLHALALYCEYIYNKKFDLLESLPVHNIN